MQRRERAVACFGQQRGQSVLVRLDYFLVILVGLKERIPPLRAVFVEVLVADFRKLLIIFLLGELTRFMPELEL